MKRGLFLFVLLVTATMANAAEKKKLSVQDVDFSFSDSYNTVVVDVAFKKSQFKKITEKDESVVEIRFYAAPASEGGSPPRIMKERRYFLQGPASSFTLKPSEACPNAGAYKAKIWLSVREDDEDNYPANKNYETFEASYKYTCASSDAVPLFMTDSFSLSDQDDDGYADQVNLKLSMDEFMFELLRYSGNRVSVKLYAEHDGHKVRIGRKKGYTMPNAVSSFTYSSESICGEMDDAWDWGFGKEVTVSCKATVLNNDGSASQDYRPYHCFEQTYFCD